MQRIALHIHNFRHGGAEGVFLKVANYLVDFYCVDLVLVRNEGVLLKKTR